METWDTELKNFPQPGVVTTHLNPSTSGDRGRAHLCAFEASLVYIASSKADRVMQKYLLSNKHNLP